MLQFWRIVILSLLLSTTYLSPQQVEAISCSVGLFQLPGSSVDCMVTHGEYAAVVGGHDHPSASSALNITNGTIDANGHLAPSGSDFFVDFTFASGIHGAGLFMTFDLFPKGTDNNFLGLALYQNDRFVGGGTFSGLPDGPPTNPLAPVAPGAGIVTDGTWSFNRVQVIGLSFPDNIPVFHIENGPAILVPPISSVSAPEPGTLLLVGLGFIGFAGWHWRTTMGRATSTMERAPSAVRQLLYIVRSSALRGQR